MIIVVGLIASMEEEELSSEEKLDQRMRTDNVWNFGKWREMSTGLGIGELDGLTQLPKLRKNLNKGTV